MPGAWTRISVSGGTTCCSRARASSSTSTRSTSGSRTSSPSRTTRRRERHLPVHRSPLDPNKILIPVGGGKDSAVTLELLGRQFPESAWWGLNPIPAARDVADASPVRHGITVSRRIDPKLLELNAAGYLNGHTPFSAYLAFASAASAILGGYGRVAVSNERSSNEGNVRYLDHDVNHQYSKTFAFEQRFREYSARYLSEQFEYLSFVRPLYEIQISRLFARYPHYFSVFRSCNRGSKTNVWCGALPEVPVRLHLAAAVRGEGGDPGDLRPGSARESRPAGLWRPSCSGAARPSRSSASARSPRPRRRSHFASTPSAARADRPRRSWPSFSNAAYWTPSAGWHPPRPSWRPGARSTPSPTTSKRSSARTSAMSLLAELRGKRVLILGFGREGRSTLAFLQERLPDAGLAVADRRTPEQMSEQERAALAALPPERVSARPGLPGRHRRRRRDLSCAGPAAGRPGPRSGTQRRARASPRSSTSSSTWRPAGSSA